jgi:hypothetical protein
MNVLKEYLKWLATTPKMLIVLLGDWYLLGGMFVGACCVLAAFFLTGRFGDAMWLRVLGGFFSLNGALFVVWRVFLKLKSEEVGR